MNEKKREKMLKAFRIIALVIAVFMMISVIMQSFVF